MARPTARRKSSGEPRQSTRDLLLDTAGALLAEVGMERISTNLICDRAGVTPPALYYYFTDKFEVIIALGQRLMDRQNEALVRWIERYAEAGLEAYAANTEELLRETAEITEADPGGVWVERALHSSPRLEHVRIESHRYVTDLLTNAFARHLPGLSRDRIWLRVRMLVEYGYMAIEMLHAEDGIARETILAETAKMQMLATLDLIHDTA
ncbi:MAG: TetR/AcrR family transcriptional regulator [Sphingomonadales bacterium]|nr:TetR/AcrR family transcriptional regulator [Sphingomonadales bacterium]